MTLAEAKGLLRRWFRALEAAAAGLPQRSADVILPGPGRESHRPGSPTELLAIARVAALEPWQQVAQAYARLSPVHQEVLWLLYGLGVGLRDVAYRLRIKYNRAVGLKDRALAAFITSLGERIDEDIEVGA
ncbi:MAG: hypothetical protein HPY55_15795 [Firmicutes bacterium]|nr:hypothetical protein [Bacillota bacterium]